MRTIGVVTTSRADYGIYRPVLRQIEAAPDLQLYLIVSGSHLSPEFGLTVEAIEFEIGDRVETLLSADTPSAISKAAGLGLIGFAQSLARFRPDILLLLGDRYEMHAAALAALPFKIPVAHIHGGEVTQGVIDDALRHSMTKLSHIHFVSAAAYARRVVQLGEDPARIFLCGAPSLDNLRTVDLLNHSALAERMGFELADDFLLVTTHPVTLEFEQTAWQTTELLAALDASGLPVLFTMPNADTNGRIIRNLINEYTETHPNAHAVESLGVQGYFSVMALTRAMVGNSSSGMVEAGLFKLPVVNVGARQNGRLRGPNIIDTGYGQEQITAGINRALSPQFMETVADMTNPFGDGRAAERIVRVLQTIKLDDGLIIKKFTDYPIDLSFDWATVS
ncbi:MAG: UDP-N-acetylglucosamine 2-epimerase (hydrolyzing) [Chloroflexi bacterium]|nr:UDP-N-acetylglucosamine 2-epimerase (hydrolyzing) [Chloroflexota bacterium]